MNMTDLIIRQSDAYLPQGGWTKLNIVILYICVDVIGSTCDKSQPFNHTTEEIAFIALFTMLVRTMTFWLLMGVGILCNFAHPLCTK